MSSFAEELVQANMDLMASKILSQWEWGTLSDPQQASLAYISSPDSSPYSNRYSPDPQDEDCERRSRQRKANKTKMSSKRRMKASEREKLRMRSLAEALHQLRDYLPPVYSRKGQPLTKIQTLKYTIEYIKELSDILNQEQPC